MATKDDKFIEKNALQIEAKAGDFIVLDCMVFIVVVTTLRKRKEEQ